MPVSDQKKIPTHSISPPETTDTSYKTKSTSFASALIAASMLEYRDAERDERGDVEFVFRDPKAEGIRLKTRFDAGLFPKVDAKALFSARGFLVDEMARLQGRGRRGQQR